MKKIGLFVLCLLSLQTCWAADPFQSGSPSSPPAGTQPKKPANFGEQNDLARRLFEQMIKTDENDIETFKQLHQQVIDLCPDTQYAMKSRWMLSNIFYAVEDFPRWEKIIEILEPGILGQPDSPLNGPALQRLMNAYRETGKTDSLKSLYEQVFQAWPDLPEEVALPWELDYARVLQNSGDVAGARKTLEKLLSSPGADKSPVGAWARQDLAALQ